MKQKKKILSYIYIYIYIYIFCLRIVSYFPLFTALDNVEFLDLAKSEIETTSIVSVVMLTKYIEVTLNR